MSRASLRRKGPRSGLSREESGGNWAAVGLSGWSFFFPLGEGLDREGEGEGCFLGRGEGGR